MKKLLLALVVIVIVGAAGLFVWARTVLTSETVRTTIASTLSTKLGQPVTIGGIGASIFPRVSLNLDRVTIGKSGNITAGTLAVATDFGALLSRRIEHATVRLDAAHVTLPLPTFTLPSSTSESATAAPASSSGSGVALVSVDEIVLNDVEVKSGGRTIRADVDLAVAGSQATVKKIELHADGTIVTVTGTLTDYTAPAGTLTVQAGAMNVTDLVAFMTDFTKGLPASTSSPTRTTTNTAPGQMNLMLTLGADKATIGALTLDHLSGQARITDTAVTIEPAKFNVFGGGYSGSLVLTLGDIPAFRVNANLTGIDMATVMTFAGHPGLVTGRMNGTMALEGRGLTAADVIASAHGTAHAAITKGTIKGLGLVKGVVLATSMRGGSTSQATSASTTESFSSLDGTFAIANGAATTRDLAFTSNDVLLAANGAVKLDGSAVNLTGPMQLSDELSKQAGRDLVKYTQKDGRVTLPATVSGSADDLHVGIDTGDLAKRAVTNAATDEAKKLLQKLGRGRGGGGRE